MSVPISSTSLQLDSIYPARQVLGHDNFGPGRCRSVVEIDLMLNVPDDWIIPRRR